MTLWICIAAAGLALAFLFLLELALYATYQLATEHLPEAVGVRAAHVVWAMREWWQWWTRREVFLVIVLSLLVGPSFGCSTTAGLRARSALDAIAVPIDAAWALAEDACMARQVPVAAKQKAGLATPEATAAALAEIRESCAPTTALFTQIRWAHQEAQQALRNGDVDRAEELLQQIRARWAELKQRSAS